MRRPSRIHREGPLLTVGMVWVRGTNGKWIAHLARRFKRCEDKAKGTIFERLHYVDDEYDFCPGCLSQQLYRILDHAPWVHCESCGVRFYFEPAPRNR